MKAKRIAREAGAPVREDWDEVRDDVMREALFAKFEQHPDLREIPLGTDEEELVEHTTNDDYWGDGGDGSGCNRLCQLLMEVREALRAGGQSEG